MTAMEVMLDDENVRRKAAAKRRMSIESISSKLMKSAEWEFMHRAVGMR